MRLNVVLRYVGLILLLDAAFMLLSVVVSLLGGMDTGFYPLLQSFVLTAILGAFPLIFVPRGGQITSKEGYAIVVGAWLMSCLAGMLPYVLWGGEFSVSDAWFEAVSGFTTTGSTILNDIEVLPRGLQFWRMSSTWIGGMGVVMFALLILPSLGRNKMTLSSVELSTLAKDNYRYRTQIIVQILLVVYVGLTVLTTVLLKMAGMNWFDSLCHAMSACATSGFSTKNASIAYFNSPMIDTILIFAMATAGIHFGLIYATVTGKRNNIFRSEVTRWYLVMLLGGGRISYYLAKMIVPMGMHVAMIEINPKKAESLSESLPHVNVILGDGTDQELLEQEGLESMDAFIAMCDRDEENLMTGLFAVKQGVPKVIVKNNRLAYADIMNGMGLDSMVSPKTITCSTILRYVRALVNSDGTKVERLYRLMNGRVEALEFIARASDSYIGIPLKNLHIRKNALVAVIARQGKVIVPFGDDKIEEGDHVVIIVCENGIGDLNEVISK